MNRLTISQIWLGGVAAALVACSSDDTSDDTCMCACVSEPADLRVHQVAVKDTFAGTFSGTVESGEVSGAQVDGVACEQEGNNFTLQLSVTGEMKCFGHEDLEGVQVPCESAANAAMELVGTLDVGDGVARSASGTVLLDNCKGGGLLVSTQFHLEYDDAYPRENFEPGPEDVPLGGELDVITWEKRHTPESSKRPIWELCILKIERH